MGMVGFKNCIFISDIYYFTKKSYSVDGTLEVILLVLHNFNFLDFTKLFSF